jgi:hypothetical protein
MLQLDVRKQKYKNFTLHDCCCWKYETVKMNAHLSVLNK